MIGNKSLDSSDAKSLLRSLGEETERLGIPVVSSTLEDLSTKGSEELKSRNLLLFARTTVAPKNADEEDIVRAMDFSYLENLIFAALKIYPKVILAYEIRPPTPQEAFNDPETLKLLHLGIIAAASLIQGRGKNDLKEKNNLEKMKAVLEFFIKLKETFGDKVEIEPIGVYPKSVKTALRLIGENENNNKEIHYRDKGGTKHIYKISDAAVIFYIDLEEVLKIVEWIGDDTTKKIFVFKPPYETQDEDQDDDLRGAKRE